MKKFTLLATALLLCTVTFAQTKDTTKKVTPPVKSKVEYQLDENKIVTIQWSMKITAGNLSRYLAVEQIGGPTALENSDKVTGAQIQQLKKIHQSVSDTLNNNLYREYTNFVKQDQAKFSADTANKSLGFKGAGQSKKPYKLN